jgi:hypothetical protein
MAALGDDRKVFLAREEQPQGLSRQRLIVYYDGAPWAGW